MGCSCEAAAAAQNSLEAAQSKILFTQQALGFSSPWKNPHTKSPCHVPVDKTPCHQTEFYPAAQTLAPQPSSSVSAMQSHEDQLPLGSNSLSTRFSSPAPLLRCPRKDGEKPWRADRVRRKDVMIHPVQVAGESRGSTGCWHVLPLQPPAKSASQDTSRLRSTRSRRCGIPSSSKAPRMEGRALSLLTQKCQHLQGAPIYSSDVSKCCMRRQRQVCLEKSSLGLEQLIQLEKGLKLLDPDAFPGHAGGCWLKISGCCNYSTARLSG